MISVACVYNNERILKDVLLKSLSSQTVGYELVALDNRDGRFKSAAQALNHGGAKAKGDYIMFVHQDVWLSGESWLEDAEGTLQSLPDLGVAGVAGVIEEGRTRFERCRWSIEDFGELWQGGRAPLQRPEVVQTLDECILIVPKGVFNRLRFDEDTFDGWDCYGADYCLCARRLGLKAYVVPGPCSHSTVRAQYQLWEFKDLVKYQKRLYRKHRGSYRRIHTWMGEVSWLRLQWRAFIGLLGPFYLRLFPSLVAILEVELEGCQTVLDLGCGYGSPLAQCSVTASVGVELFEPYLQESRRKGVHGEYILADLRMLEFAPGSFDAVIATDVLEHLSKEEGIDLIDRMARWARKKVIVTTPNGYVEQDPYDGNPLQEHKTGWTVDELREQGFRVAGIGGWKALRGYKALVKWRPAFLWTRVSDITQKITYYYPRLAFLLLGVRRVDHLD